MKEDAFNYGVGWGEKNTVQYNRSCAGAGLDRAAPALPPLAQPVLRALPACLRSFQDVTEHGGRADGHRQAPSPLPSTIRPRTG